MKNKLDVLFIRVMTHKHFFYIILSFVFITSCSKSTDNNEDRLQNPFEPSGEDNVEDTTPVPPDTVQVQVWEIPYKNRGGVAVLPVKVNGMKLDMLLDTGTILTTITIDEAKYMLHNGILSPSDILDYGPYLQADRQIFEGIRVLLRNIIIGNNNDMVLKNIEATIVEEHESAPLVLGQSALNSFSEISINKDNYIIKFVAKQKD